MLCKNEKVLDPCVNIKSRNIGPGGERCLADGIRFMYVCLKGKACGGFTKPLPN